MRKYLPTLGELIDRLSIVQLKEVKIPQHKEEYAKEIEDIVSSLRQQGLPEFDEDVIRDICQSNELYCHILIDNKINKTDTINIATTI